MPSRDAETPDPDAVGTTAGDGGAGSDAGLSDDAVSGGLTPGDAARPGSGGVAPGDADGPGAVVSAPDGLAPVDPAAKKPLRQRIREAGGFYEWWNKGLVKYGGPASVGPYDTEPEPERIERPCPLCRKPMSQHTFDRSGPKPLMRCP